MRVCTPPGLNEDAMASWLFEVRSWQIDNSNGFYKNDSPIRYQSEALGNVRTIAQEKNQRRFANMLWIQCQCFIQNRVCRDFLEDRWFASESCWNDQKIRQKCRNKYQRSLNTDTWTLFEVASQRTRNIIQNTWTSRPEYMDHLWTSSEYLWKPVQNLSKNNSRSRKCVLGSFSMPNRAQVGSRLATPK